MISDFNPLNGTADVVASIKKYSAQPFSTEMDLTHWFLWTGLVIIMAFAWFMILKEIDFE